MRLVMIKEYYNNKKNFSVRHDFKSSYEEKVVNSSCYNGYSSINEGCKIFWNTSQNGEKSDSSITVVLTASQRIQ